MTVPERALLGLRDPLIVALGQDFPINVEIVEAAIEYRERQFHTPRPYYGWDDDEILPYLEERSDLLREEIQALKVARSHLLQQAGVPR